MRIGSIDTSIRSEISARRVGKSCRYLDRSEVGSEVGAVKRVFNVPTQWSRSVHRERRAEPGRPAYQRRDHQAVFCVSCRAAASLIASASARSARGAERHSFTGVRMGAPLPFSSTT